MKRFVLNQLLLSLTLMLLAGCSIDTYKTADISKNPKAVQFAQSSIQFLINFPFYELEIAGPNDTNDSLIVNYNQSNRKKLIVDYLNKLKANIKPGTEKIGITIKYAYESVITDIDLPDNQTFSVKYHRCLLHDAPNISIPVEFPNGRKYIAYLDTGFDSSVILTSDIVIKNKLRILPIADMTFQGMCHIPEFTIGSARIKDASAFYGEQQWQLRILNIPVYNHPAIILGLRFIRTFDYVLFDNVNQEVVFSKAGVFKPDNQQLWTSYPFEIKPDSIQNERLMVKIPLNGQVYELFFDSCGDKPGLDLNKNDWETIKPNLSVKRFKKSSGYSYQAGRIFFQKAAVSQITVGETTIKNVEIKISEDPEDLSVLSLGYFQDTSFVLDFINNLMWIKK